MRCQSSGALPRAAEHPVACHGSAAGWSADRSADSWVAPPGSRCGPGYRVRHRCCGRIRSRHCGRGHPVPDPVGSCCPPGRRSRRTACRWPRHRHCRSATGNRPEWSRTHRAGWHRVQRSLRWTVVAVGLDRRWCHDCPHCGPNGPSQPWQWSRPSQSPCHSRPDPPWLAHRPDRPAPRRAPRRRVTRQCDVMTALCLRSSVVPASEPDVGFGDCQSHHN